MVKTPGWTQRIFPKRTWTLPNTDHSVYLTFDDGPIPEITPWVLDQLDQYNFKATFFCIGDNIRKHPEIFNRIISEGHSVGNHTFNHLNGRKTRLKDYLENVELCDQQIKNLIPHTTPLFRPPYGRLTGVQAKSVRKLGYKIIMWDILSFDFDADVSQEQCLQNVIQHIKPGSIVVFHDSLKAQKNLQYALPKVLNYISERKWRSEKIESLDMRG